MNTLLSYYPEALVLFKDPFRGQQNLKYNSLNEFMKYHYFCAITISEYDQSVVVNRCVEARGKYPLNILLSISRYIINHKGSEFILLHSNDRMERDDIEARLNSHNYIRKCRFANLSGGIPKYVKVDGPDDLTPEDIRYIRHAVDLSKL